MTRFIRALGLLMLISIPFQIFTLIFQTDSRLIWTAVTSLFSGAFFYALAETVDKNK